MTKPKLWIVVNTVCDGGKYESFAYGPYASKAEAGAVRDALDDEETAWCVAEVVATLPVEDDGE